MSGEDAESRLDAALALARAGDVTASWTLTEAALKQEPHNPTVLRKAAMVLRLRGDAAGERDLLRRAVATQQAELAEACLVAGQRETALRWFRQAAETAPEDPHVVLRAARLERELGRAWHALLLLEALYEHLPGHQEANRLRGEWLREHAANPGLSRDFPAAVGDPEGWRVHFRHLRALTEIADWAGVLTHVDNVQAAAGSELASHAAAFAGHAKLAMNFDHVAAGARAAALWASSDRLDTPRLAERLRAAIADREPLSLIRLGDGEARFLALDDPWARGILSPAEAESIADVIWRNWFGSGLEATPAAERAALAARFAVALRDADILGISPPERYARDTFHRGYLGLLERAIDTARAASPGLAFTHAFANILLHQRSPFYREWLAGLDFLGCISPHPGLADRLARYHGIAACREYLVPGEARLPETARRMVGGTHFPERFRAIMAELSVPRRGAVFVVAAGLLGKIYCHHIRRQGGIAIDIGSVADAWMGYATRPGLYQNPEQWVLPLSAPSYADRRKH